MKKIIFFSDIHLGLVTSEIDRTGEIVQVSLQAVNHAVKLKKKGYDTILVIGGDIFHHNNPSDFLISQFIRIINPAVKAGIEISVLVGNHDSISNPQKKSCLQFLKKLKGEYSCVKVVDDMKVRKWFTADYGHVYLTFFPHITKAHLDGTNYKSTQSYIDGKAKKIWEHVGPGQNQIVFSHLNVKGLIPGTEENLLKRSESWLPDFYTTTEEHSYFVGSLPPTIVQAHLHSRQKHKNIRVIGTQLFCDFGEKEKKKFFAEISVPETFGEKQTIKYKKVDCRPFIEVEIDLTTDDCKKFPKLPSNAIVKLNVTVNEKDAFKHNWEKLRSLYAEKVYYVKPVQPKIIRGRIVRNKKQLIKLSPVEASRVFLKKNKPKGWKRKLELAKDYIERLQHEN